MIKKASDPQLKQGFRTHLAETKNQVKRLDQVFKMLGRGSENLSAGRFTTLWGLRRSVYGLAAEGVEAAPFVGGRGCFASARRQSAEHRSRKDHGDQRRRRASAATARHGSRRSSRRRRALRGAPRRDRRRFRRSPAHKAPPHCFRFRRSSALVPATPKTANNPGRGDMGGVSIRSHVRQRGPRNRPSQRIPGDTGDTRRSTSKDALLRDPKEMGSAAMPNATRSTRTA